jgi:hypothetical protein
VFNVERDHLAETDAEDGISFFGLGRKGVVVENEDADDRVGNDERDGAGAGPDLGERGTDGRGDDFRRREIGFGDAGQNGAGRERLECVYGRLAGCGDGGGENAIGRKLDGGGRTRASVCRDAAITEWKSANGCILRG